MTKNKDKKGKESTIGKIIYGFLLFMPLFAIGVTCLYAIFNKNAYQSYDNYEEEQVSNVALNTHLVQGQTYYLNPLPYNTAINTTYYEVLDNRTNIQQIYFPNNTDLNYITKFAIATSGTRTRLIAYGNNNTNYSIFDMTESFYFVSNGTNELNTQNPQPYTITTLTYTTGKVSNVFYYSINKVEDSNLFNWAKNSIVYTTLVATCNALSITNTFIPMLLAYWLIISIIYILYDIALMMIIIFHHKVHCLQDSI